MPKMHYTFLISDNQYVFFNFVLMHLEIYHYFLLDIIMESFFL